MSYTDLADQANRIARVFKTIGLRWGDAIGLVAGNSPHVVAVAHAAQILGLRYTPLHPLGSEEDHAFILEDAVIGTLIVDPVRFAQRGTALSARRHFDYVLTLGPSKLGKDLLTSAMDQDGSDLPIEALPDDICNLNYTGGTTGLPKGVVYRHRSIINMLTQELAFWEWPQELRFLVTTPLSHAAGAMLTPTLVLGGTFFFHQVFDPAAFFATVERERITAAFLVQTMLYALLDDPRLIEHDLSSLQMLLYGASSIVPARLIEAVQRFGPILSQLYGQSEAAQTIAYLAKGDHDLSRPERFGSCGFPVPAVRR